MFAVGAERGVVKLYDARNWAAGPFTSFPVRPQTRRLGVAVVCGVRWGGGWAAGPFTSFRCARLPTCRWLAGGGG